MIHRVAVHIDGMPIGFLVWDEQRQQAWFETNLEALSVLGYFAWSTLSEAQAIISQYAYEAGINARGAF